MSNKKDSNQTEDFYRKLMKATNAVGAPHFNSEPEQAVKVNIRPDKSVGPAMFKPDPLLPGGFKAHPTTIKAMRKDIFVGGQDGFIDLEKLVDCLSCKKEIDLQFWKFCPYCEAQLPPQIDKN